MSLRDYNEYKRLIERISKAIINANVSHAYIIEGDSCIDKEAFAKDFIKAVLCLEEPGFGCDRCVNCRKIDHDNYEDMYILRADELSLKDAAVSGLQENLKNKPSAGNRNIAIIEGADSMTPRAQNRLLKTLEEPNPGTIIILLSENTENLLQTITSRCIIYRLGNFVQSNQNDKLAFAQKIIDMVLEGCYFCDLKETLTKGVKDRKEAFMLLDGLERLFSGDMAGDDTGAMRKEKIIENVRYVEEARRDLLANVNYKYAIRNLILKIGG
ncbi:MAG: hypothetical protein ACLRJC_18125 [Emergencia timonensis]|uniref:hypothetical protein n=1 Tax=Emergencia timonensis TaxID=1776384 RepID=UPI00082C3486|nr:hypothetical protein [Emergencia timonensis]WNX88223.1 hypothetical protein RVY71_18755 [Emergencia timonensis]